MAWCKIRGFAHLTSFLRSAMQGFPPVLWVLASSWNSNEFVSLTRDGMSIEWRVDYCNQRWIPMKVRSLNYVMNGRIMTLMQRIICFVLKGPCPSGCFILKLWKSSQSYLQICRLLLYAVKMRRRHTRCRSGSYLQCQEDGTYNNAATLSTMSLCRFTCGRERRARSYG